MNAPEHVARRGDFATRQAIRERMYAGEPLPLVCERFGHPLVASALGSATFHHGSSRALERAMQAAAERLHEHRRLDRLLQLAIAVLGLAGMYAIALPPGEPLRPYGFWLLLGSQPFWFVSSVRARQWGIFANAIFYTGALVQGVVNNFF